MYVWDPEVKTLEALEEHAGRRRADVTQGRCDAEEIGALHTARCHKSRLWYA